MVQGRTEFKEPKTVSSIVEKTELETLEDIRWREHLGRSEIIRKAIQDYIKIHAAGNDTFTIEQFQDPNFRAMPATMSPIKDWKEFINYNTEEKEDRALELKCLGIIGAIKDKRNAKISNSS